MLLRLTTYDQYVTAQEKEKYQNYEGQDGSGNWDGGIYDYDCEQGNRYNDDCGNYNGEYQGGSAADPSLCVVMEVCNPSVGSVDM